MEENMKESGKMENKTVLANIQIKKERLEKASGKMG
jgi:hypothetical protein